MRWEVELHDRMPGGRDDIHLGCPMSEAVVRRDRPSDLPMPRWRWLTSEHPLPWLLPAAALMTIFGIYPLLYALWLSLHKRNPVTRLNVFDPDHNWAKALGDQRVWDAVATTLLYTGIALVVPCTRILLARSFLIQCGPLFSFFTARAAPRFTSVARRICPSCQGRPRPPTPGRSAAERRRSARSVPRPGSG